MANELVMYRTRKGTLQCTVWKMHNVLVVWDVSNNHATLQWLLLAGGDYYLTRYEGIFQQTLHSVIQHYKIHMDGLEKWLDRISLLTDGWMAWLNCRQPLFTTWRTGYWCATFFIIGHIIKYQNIIVENNYLVFNRTQKVTVSSLSFV